MLRGEKDSEKLLEAFKEIVGSERSVSGAKPFEGGDPKKSDDISCFILPVI